MNTEYISMKADQINRHKKVFTRWINLQLAKAKPPVEVSDLVGQFRDGQMLLSLVEVLLEIQVTRAEPASKRINQIRNVQEAMRHLLKNNVKTTGIIASEITSGDQRAILRLVWSIIQRFQIHEAIQPDPRDYGVDKKLITWCQERIQGHRNSLSKNVSVYNLTSSWNDGIAFNVLLHTFNPSAFDLDEITSSDATSRLTHAFNLATTAYGVPSLFDPEDVGMDTPDKNLITLFLSYLYQLNVKRRMVKVVKKVHDEVTLPAGTRKEYEFRTITSYHETPRTDSTTYSTKTITTTTREEKGHEVFHDVKSFVEGGQEKVLHVYGFPQNVEIQERRAFVVSPFRKPTSISSTSSSTSGASSPVSSPSAKDSDTKEMAEVEALKFSPPPQISGEKSYEFTVTNTRIVSNGGDRISSTTTKKGLEATPVETTGPRNVTNDHKDWGNVAEMDSDEVSQEELAISEKTITHKEDAVEITPRRGREVVLISAERITSGSTARDTEAKLTEPSSPPSTAEEDAVPAYDVAASDVGPPRYFKYHTDGSSPPRSNNFMDYLKKKLDTVDQSLFDLDDNLKHSDKDSMDLKTTKNALDHHKEILLQLEHVESKTYDVLEEGKGLINDKSFDGPYEDYFNDRMDNIEVKMKKLEENINKEHQRLFDLYLILLKQHLERMNDWLVRAESRMALDDAIELTCKDVKQQVSNHQAFQEDLSNYSMVNMILDLDLEDPVIDETIKDWVKVLSERWAAVWTWAEEWREKLNQALLDWNNFRREEDVVLSWLSSKEQTLKVIGQTDITDEEQVKTHLNLLETLEREMDTQGRRLESLHETGEQLIKDAEYHNSTAKGIRDQLEDFDKCWSSIDSSISERKAVLKDSQTKFKKMGNLMKEVRSWLDDAEKFIKLLREENDQQKENKIQEKIELKCEERDRNQLKVDEMKQLEDAISNSIDQTSNYFMKRVTRPFHKRWNDTSIALNRYRNDDYPFIKTDDCFMVKCLKKALAVN